MNRQSTVNSAGVSNAAVMKLLGKDVKYPTTYDPSVLVKELRETNRKAIGLDSNCLPFKGHDIWHLWEMSCINGSTNLPEVGIFKLIYSASSKYLVESKSLKLYTFSFNNDTYPNGLNDVADIMKRDLSSLLETDVQIIPYSIDHSKIHTLNPETMFINPSLQSISVDTDDWKTQSKVTVNTNVMFMTTSLLRSLCRVTSAPDYGDSLCYFNTKQVVNTEYIASKFRDIIISFRNQNHFHEESCEGIYHQMYNILKEYNIIDLFVCCLYTRRGGIDISPFRYYKEAFFSEYGVANLFKTARQ